MDINDNRPLFDRNSFEKAILENVPDGSEIVKFTAKDLDEVSEKTKLILPKTSQIFQFFSNFSREIMLDFCTPSMTLLEPLKSIHTQAV